jgi:hypothetical protein
MHLISPTAPYYQGADVLLTADCVAYALGDFHREFLKGKSLAIACPKLDEGQDIYLEKIKSWFEDAKINTLTVLIMQVPCCMGLLNLTQQASGRVGCRLKAKALANFLQEDNWSVLKGDSNEGMDLIPGLLRGNSYDRRMPSFWSGQLLWAVKTLLYTDSQRMCAVWQSSIVGTQ